MTSTDFKDDVLLAFIEQQYNLTGEVLTAEAAFEKYGIPVGHYKRVLKENADALEEKGIVVRTADDWTATTLSPLQLAVANALLDLTDTRSNKKKLQDLEVHTQTYNSWLKDPVFRGYLAQRAKQMIGDNEHEVDLALLDRIRAGDLKAIEYYNEMQGRFTRQRANASAVDVQNVLIKVIEIISEEVSNPQDAMRISNRLRAMVTARNVAGALIGAEEAEPISVPEIVETRALTPELEQ